MEYEVVIERLNDQAFGVGYINSKVVFVENAMPGDIVKVEIIKERKNILMGKIKRFVKYSSLRVDSMCKYASRCGGCKLATLDYLETIKYKKEKLEHILKKFGNLDLDIPIVGIEREDKYISSVNSNNYSGSYEAVNLLVENKCDELFHINNLPNEKIAAYDRIKAFENVCNENNKEPHFYFRDFNESYDDTYKELFNIYKEI